MGITKWLGVALKWTDASYQDETGKTLLHYLVLDGYEVVLQLLLTQQGVRINIQDVFGASPLHLAVRKNAINIVKQLLAHKKTNINIQDIDLRTPLHDAAWEGHVEVVKLLLRHRGVFINAKDKDGMTILHVAVRRDLIEIVQILLQYDELLVNEQDRFGWTALHDAAYNGKIEIVQMLLMHKKINVGITHMDIRTPLHEAVTGGHLAIVALLIRHTTIQINLKDSHGWTALYYAVDKQRSDIVKMLLMHQADIGDQSMQYALFKCCMLSNDTSLFMLHYLLAKGLNTQPDEKTDYFTLEITNALLVEQMHTIRDNFKNAIEALTNHQLQPSKIPLFLKALPYALNLWQAINRPFAHNTPKNLDAHIAEYRCVASQKDKRDELLQKSAQYLKQQSTLSLEILNQMNILKALQYKANFPNEIMNYIVNYLLEDDFLGDAYGIALKEMLPFYSYIQDAPHAFLHLHEEIFTHDWNAPWPLAAEEAKPVLLACA